jgi:hypothetical protein
MNSKEIKTEFDYPEAHYKKLLIELHGIKAGTEGFELWMNQKKKLPKKGN